MWKIIRTDEKRFLKLPNFNYKPNYLEYKGCRIHYIDHQPKGSTKVALMLHGEPTWSFLYRKMIPVFAEAGYRCVAPDFIGFGRSDKLVEDKDYTFHMHRDMILWFIKSLNLQNITLVCQDWGGLIGLTLPMDMSERFNQLVVMNTGFGTGDIPLGKGFEEWRKYVASGDFSVGKLMKRSCPDLSQEEVDAYDAPFPDITYKAGVRSFPTLVCDHPDAPGADVSRKAREWFRTQWQGKIFMAVGMQDPVLGPSAMKYLHKQIKGCPPPYQMEKAGHFVQEWGEEVAKKAIEQFSKSSKL